MSFYDIGAAMTAPGFMDFTTNCWKYLRLCLFATQRMISHYWVFNRLISMLHLLSFNVLCKIVASSITNERKLRRPVLAVSLFLPDISLFYLVLYFLCHPWEFSSEPWQSEGHLKIILWAEWTAIWALSVLTPYKTS